MTPTNDYSMCNKDAVLWALANQYPDFVPFHDGLRNEIELKAPVSAELIDEVMAVVEADPELADKAKLYQENAEAALTFGIFSLPEVSILIASLFILGTHIKIHRTPEGKWEILVEHESMVNEALLSVAEKIINLLK